MTQTPLPVDIPGVISLHGLDGQSVPLVFDSPHSGTDYPDDFVTIAPMHLLRQAEDTDVHVLFGDAVESGAAFLEAHFPRAYIDPNRAETDMDPAQIDGTPPWPLVPGPKSRQGIGLCWTEVPPDGGAIYAARLTADQLRQRVERYHRPYHAALEQIIDRTHAKWGQVWHINCHSMPEFPNAMAAGEDRNTRRADFVLGDRDGSTCAPEFTETVRAYLAGLGYEVKINDPYKGVELVRLHGRPAESRHSLQVEVNRALYMDEATRARNDSFAATRAALKRLAAHLAEFAKDRS